MPTTTIGEWEFDRTLPRWPDFPEESRIALLEAEAQGFRQLGVCLRSPVEEPRFDVGYVCWTRGVELLFGEDVEAVLALVARHQAGDWGTVDAHDMGINETAVHAGARLLSQYEHGHERVWIITEWDRSVTTVLLPSDY